MEDVCSIGIHEFFGPRSGHGQRSSAFFKYGQHILVPVPY